MRPEEKIDELFERIFDLNGKIIWKEKVEETIREMLLHSHLTIQECENIFYFLNLEGEK